LLSENKANEDALIIGFIDFLSLKIEKGSSVDSFGHYGFSSSKKHQTFTIVPLSTRTITTFDQVGTLLFPRVFIL
jgi:hypothetical protein